MTKRILLVVLALGLLLALGISLGCQQDGGADAETSTATLPDGFPADVPVYEGTIVDSEQSEAASGAAYTVDITAPEKTADVVEWYQRELASEGWMIATAALPNGDGNVIAADKDGQSVTVTVIETDDGSDLTIDVAPID